MFKKFDKSNQNIVELQKKIYNNYIEKRIFFEKIINDLFIMQ